MLCQVRVCFIKDLKDLGNGTGTYFYRHVGPKGPKTPSLDDGDRGGQAPALREHRDREVSPTETEL